MTFRVYPSMATTLLASAVWACLLLAAPAAHAQDAAPTDPVGTDTPADMPTDEPVDKQPEKAVDESPSGTPPALEFDDKDGTVVDAEDGAIDTTVPLEEIRRYVTVYSAIKQAYVEPVKDKDLMEAAIRGLLFDLDPHSVYFDKESAEDFDEQSRGAYEGIGVELQRQPDGNLKVIAPIDGTPAERAGLQSGDIITAIDGKSFDPDEGDTSAPLRGPAGSSLTLTIVRKGEDAPFDVTLTRDTIRITSIRGRMLEPGHGYIRISAFQADTAADFEAKLAELKTEAGGTLKGLVIDLRSNPGGLLTSAVQIADDLLETGVIVSTRGRISISDAEFSATPGDRLDGAPVVVLVDAGSASASEVLAGALRDNGRVRVVGSRTFGKGSVQTLLPLDNGDSVKLTTARYYTPSGKSIQALGIVPDVVLHPAVDAANGGRASYVESSLPGHLSGDEEGEGNAGDNAGEVLSGDSHIASALAELKKVTAASVSPPLPVSPPKRTGTQ